MMVSYPRRQSRCAFLYTSTPQNTTPEGVQVADITLGKTKARTGKLSNSFLVCWEWLYTSIIFLAETMDDVYSVQDILAKYMERDDIQRLFIKLGLSEITVGGYHDIADKKKYARGLIVAWRNEQDKVLIKYPAGATWENLRNALIDIGQSGTAKKLE